MAQKISTFLLYSLLILFPFGEIFRYQLFFDIAITLNDLAVVFVSGVWLVMSAKKIKMGILFTDVTTKAIGIFIVVLFLSLLVNIQALSLLQLVSASLYIVRWIMYALLFGVVTTQSLAKKRKLLWFMIASGMATVLLGIGQYIFYPNLANLYYLGWDEHLYRLFGTFLDPNFTGGFFVLLFLLLMGIFIYFLRRGAKKQTFITGICVLITLFSIFLTYSRGALVMLFVGFGVQLFLWRKKYLFFCFLILVGFGIFISELLFHSEGTNLLRTTSTFARKTSYLHAARIIQDHPFFGVGFNAYRYAQEKYGFLKGENGFPDHAASGTDNSFLFIAATAGIFGLIAFVNLLIMQARQVISMMHAASDMQKTLATVFFASLIGLCVNAFFINSLFYPFLMEWMWILFGIMVSM